MGKSRLIDKVRALPMSAGVYLFKDEKGKVIYVGKASRLKSRVGSYFRTPTAQEPKTLQMIGNARDLSFIETPGEFEALFLESELIKRYRPKYNVIWQDEKNFLYLRINKKEKFPTIAFVRRPLDDGATYLGPFIDARAVKSSIRILRKAFPYHTHPNMPRRACLDYHLGLCAGPEIGAVSERDYKKMINRLIAVIRGKEKGVLAELKADMKRSSKAREYERAAKLRDQVRDLISARKKVLFGGEESLSLSADQGLLELGSRLGLAGTPKRIEAYDISHIQGAAMTASMVVFVDGAAKRDEYRKFRIRTVKGIDDFKALQEVVTRRFKNDWARPDLLVIDGGKGQLSAVDAVLTRENIGLPRIGLAKREETIIQMQGNKFTEIKLPETSHALKLLQRIRDEAHRFAITYQSVLSGKKISTSKLDSIPGVGDKTRKKLIRHFGSVKGVTEADEQEVAAVVGGKLARVIKDAILSRL